MPLERVTDGLFDYAGMFPPAALSFEDALAESARFPETLHDPELVAADMVLTPDALTRLTKEALHEAGYAGRPCRVCLVGVPVTDAPKQAEAVVAFNRERAHDSPPQRIISLEVHFENEDITTIQGAMDKAQRILDACTDRVQLYLEPKWDDARLAKGLTGVMQIMDSINHDAPHVGFKVRCAGPTALSHATLAKVMAHVNLRSIPLKLTQGLHHPFAGDPTHGNVHGFLNVVFGLRLHRDTDMDVEELATLLADDAPADFVWDHGIGWRGRRISMQSVVESSLAVPFSIGSCSIAEPDADLSGLRDRT